VDPFVPPQRPLGEGGRTLDERRDLGSAALGRAGRSCVETHGIVCPKATSMLPKLITFWEPLLAAAADGVICAVRRRSLLSPATTASLRRTQRAEAEKASAALGCCYALVPGVDCDFPVWGQPKHRVQGSALRSTRCHCSSARLYPSRKHSRRSSRPRTPSRHTSRCGGSGVTYRFLPSSCEPCLGGVGRAVGLHINISTALVRLHDFARAAGSPSQAAQHGNGGWSNSVSEFRCEFWKISWCVKDSFDWVEENAL
jgi:hypothetical protein